MNTISIKEPFVDNTRFRVDFVHVNASSSVPCGMNSIRHVGPSYPPLHKLHLPRVGSHVYIISEWKENDYVILDTIDGTI